MEYMGFDQEMSLEEFAEEMKNEIPNYLMDINIESIKIDKVNKNNGVALIGMVIVEQGENIAPNIYLERYYQMYKNGVVLDEICNNIANDYRNAVKSIPDLDIDRIISRENLYVKLVNYDANKNIMAHSIFEKHMDMALMVRVMCSETENGLCSTALDFKSLDKLGLTYDEAIQVAKENTLMKWPTRIVPMTEMIDIPSEIVSDKFEMYVVTNSTGINGATSIIDMDTIKDYFGDRDMYILPSSIHECIFIPDIGKGEEQLAGLVKEVNKFIVSREEKLSNNVYKYDGKEKTIIQCTGLDKSKDNPERDM